MKRKPVVYADIIDVIVTLAPSSPPTIDDVIAWIKRDPRVGALLDEYQAIVEAKELEVVAARVAEGKRFLATLPAGKADELMSALAAARARLD